MPIMNFDIESDSRYGKKSYLIFNKCIFLGCNYFLLFFLKELKWNYLRNFNVLIADKKREEKNDVHILSAEWSN